MGNKMYSCIRTKKDQDKIEAYHYLIDENELAFKNTAKQISLAGNEIRLKILWLLNKEEFCVCDLSDILQMSVPAISQHLRKLKDAEMLDFRRDGQTLYYFIHSKLSIHIKSIVEESFAHINSRNFIFRL